MIFLYHGFTDCETKETKWYANYASEVRRELNSVEKTQFWNCSTCGGLLPDLEVQGRERSFRFVCTHIVENENGKVIMQTDYTKLLLYLLATRVSKENIDLPMRDFIHKLEEKKE
jgi:hypothetical protein